MDKTMLDIFIVGGGMVGASLALAMKQTNFAVGLAETRSLQDNAQPSYDDRGIAISQGSFRILKGLGLWPALADQATAIRHIHVSDRGHFGVTRLSAEQERVSALGYVITARELGQVLNQQLQQQQNLHIFCPASVTALKQYDDHVEVTLNHQQTIKTRLLVAADGRDSSIRQLLQLGSWTQDYQQTAITANVSTDRPHEGRAFERFTDSGPLALLPMSKQRHSLVWTVKRGDEAALLALNEQDFLTTLQQRFGYRAGRFTFVGQRNTHPLSLMQADMPVQQRVVFIGNAAHNLHPIAGQGFNLGLRDVAVLADIIVEYHSDPGDSRALFHYQQNRQHDQDFVVKTTDHLVRIFSNDIRWLGHARSASLALLDVFPPAKHWLAKSSMGLTIRQPRLARGLPL